MQKITSKGPSSRTDEIIFVALKRSPGRRAQKDSGKEAVKKLLGGWGVGDWLRL